MIRLPRRFLPVFLALAVIPAPAQGNDHHYWTTQVGARSALMGGAVVGGVRDASAGYYNPGALGFAGAASLSVSSDAYRVEHVVLEDGAGPGRDLESTQVEAVPLLLSGVFLPGWGPKHVLGYSVLTRNTANTKSSARLEAQMDVTTLELPGLPDLYPGEEDYVGQYSAETDFTELWGGLSYGYRVGEGVSIGVTHFLALRTYQETVAASARAVNPQTFAASSTDRFATVDYWDLRALWKFGAVAQWPSVKVGVAVTTPSIHIAGRGTVARDETVTNVDLLGDGTLVTISTNDRQEDLATEVRSPLSVAVGLEWAPWSETVLAVSAEWFAGQDRYTVIDPDSENPVLGDFFESVDSEAFLRVTDADRSVINVAVAVEQEVTESLRAYLSARTDFSTRKDDSGSLGLQPGSADWDLYHLGLGATYRGKRSLFSLGFEYSFGRSGKLRQPVDFDSARDDNFLLGDRRDVDARYRAFALILGFSYEFQGF